MIYGFNTYRLDTDRLELWRGGKAVAVEPQVFHLLQHLIENRERVVSKDELIEHVWSGRIVSDATLSSRINAARRAVGDSGAQQAVIRTTVRRGFRFVAEVREGEDSEPRPAPQSTQAAETDQPHGTVSAVLGPQQATPSAVEPAHVIDGERKQVTALSVGIRGAGELVSALDPETALAEIDPVLKAMSEAVARYGGTVSTMLNDGMLVLFGAPQAQEDHAVRAGHAALAIRDAVRDLGSGRLAAAIGVHSAEAVVRRASDGEARAYEAVGPAAQIAHRLQEAVGPGLVALTEETCRRVRGYFDLRAAGTMTLGAGGSLAVFHLTAPLPARTSWQARAARPLTRFVGHDNEMDQIAMALQRAGLGRGELVAIVGEPGVGKSRLAHEFLGSRNAHAWTLLETGAASHDGSDAYRPVADLLRSWLLIDKQDNQTTIAEKVRAQILGLDKGLEPTLPALFTVLGLPVDDRHWVTLSPPLRRRNTIAALKTVFVRESRHRPLILVFEDLHWFDEETLAFVDDLVNGLGAARLLLIVTYRPEFSHRWAGKSAYSEIRLRPLPDDDAGQLLGALFGDHPDLLDLRRLLIERTQGTPLFLEESVQALIETKVLVGAPGAYRLAKPIDSFEVPVTIQSVLAARIDRLPLTSKHLLQVAAVIGETVPLAVLELASEMASERMFESLADLQAGEFLFESQFFPRREYSFKHALTHEVSYRTLLRSDRAALHRRVAGILERLHAERIAEVVESIAAHFAAGEDWINATKYFIMAAERAKELYSYKHATQIARKALDTSISGGLSDHASRAHVLLGDIQSLLGDLETANRHYDAAAQVEMEEERRRVIENKRHRPAFLTAGDARLAYYEHGSGDQTLVLIHPFIYGFHVFQPIVERLCQTFRIVTIDGRGTGASDPLPLDYNIDDHVRDFIAVLKAVKQGQQITAVGMSRGVNLLVKLAHKEPGLVDRIVLVGGGVRQTIGIGINPTRGALLKNRHGRVFAEALEAGNFRKAIKLFSRTIYSEPGTKDLRVQFEEQCLKLPRDTLVNFFTFDPKIDIEALAEQVRTPTLVMHGAEDKDIAVEDAIAMAQSIPNAQFYGFEGKGHLPTFTATAEFCERLIQFVEETPAKDGQLLAQIPEKPSIAVLPFDNLSGDDEQEYFADGITGDIITELSRFRSLHVIGRSSSFTYKGKAVRAQGVGRDLGIGYLVEGSVRKTGRQVRITARLVDTQTGKNLWAERYDRDLEDFFGVQDEIIQTIAAAIEPELGAVERHRSRLKRPESLDAWDCYQLGLWHMHQDTKRGAEEAVRHCNGAIARSPDFAPPYAVVAYVLLMDIINGHTEPSDSVLEEALRMAEQAVALDDKDSLAHKALGRTFLLQRKHDDAVAELETAVALNPGDADAHHDLGFVLIFSGRPKDAVPELEAAIRLSPFDPGISSFYEILAWALLVQGRFADALEPARTAVRRPNAQHWAHATLSVVLGHLDKLGEAMAVKDQVLHLKPDFSIGFVERFVYYNKCPSDLQIYMDGMRKAGFPA